MTNIAYLYMNEDNKRKQDKTQKEENKIQEMKSIRNNPQDILGNIHSFSFRSCSLQIIGDKWKPAILDQWQVILSINFE